MGKSLPSATRLQEFSRIITSERVHLPNRINPVSKPQIRASLEPAKFPGASVQTELKSKVMEDSSETQIQSRQPLSAVVSDCVKRWFQDTLKEAKAGDCAMQVLVGQMYYSGYGVTKDAQKGRAWIKRASKSRSSVWRVGDKHPGYNASDSDSDDTKAADAK